MRDIRYLEFAANPSGTGDVIQLGDGSSAQFAPEQVPHHIVLNHVYVHGDRFIGQKRCIALNAADVTISDSYVSDCKSATQDSQAICGWNGPGPFTIENNYLEAAGENVMFGGSDPSIADLVPSNITFRGNHVSRPMSWRDPIVPTPGGVSAAVEADGLLPPGIYAYRIVARHVVGNGTIARSTASAEVTADATRPDNSVRIHWDPVPGATEYLVYGRTAGAETTFWKVTTTEFVDTGEAGSPGAVPTTAGTRWVVKNLFELKAGRNVVVESNIFENNWLNGQNGYAVVLTPRNSGGCPWCVVEDVSFRYNLVRNTASGFNLLGYDNSGVTKQTNNIRIAHNVMVLSTTLGGQGWFVQMGDEPRDVKLCHNTIDSNGTTVVYVYGGTATDPREVLGFEYAGNAARHNNYGMNGGFFTFGNAILNAWYPGYTWEANYLAGASASKYPAGTLVISPFENQFIDTAAGDYTVRAGSPLQGAGPTTAGLCGGDADIVPHPDIGADHGTLTARVASVRAAAPASVPTPPTAAVSVTCTYLDCVFSDQSAEGSAAPARRSWRFGDGTESTDAAGTHTYGAAGTYTIRLIVWDANDLSDTQTTTVKVRAPNVAPTASFRASCVDLVCTFTDSSADPDGPIVAWAWTFGSSGTSTDAAPTFRFPQPGTYQVSLTVTDSDGATATTTVPAVQVTGVLHVSFVDAVITSGKNGKGTPHWAVSATVEAHGADERVITGATLTVTWDGVRTSSCMTSTDGRCTFNSGALSAKQSSVTLTVLGVSAASSVYQPPANHDPAGNATGMSMTYVKP